MLRYQAPAEHTSKLWNLWVAREVHREYSAAFLNCLQWSVSTFLPVCLKGVSKGGLAGSTPSLFWQLLCFIVGIH